MTNKTTSQAMLDALDFRYTFLRPNGLHHSSLALQRKLIEEESKEVAEAAEDLKSDITNRRAREHLLKEVGDLVYVCFQMAVAFGWDLDEALHLIHQSNLSKLDENEQPIFREDGKILKGPNYTEPSLIHLV